MNIFLFQHEFSSVEPTEAFTESTASFVGKSPIMPPSDLTLNFLLKRTAYQDHKLPAVGLFSHQVTNRLFTETSLLVTLVAILTG